MTRLPLVLRACVLALLVLALALPSLWRPASVAGRVVRLRTASDLAKAGALLGGLPPAATIYESATPPSPNELETLAAAAGRAPLFGVLPATARLVDASATARPLSGRAAAVSFRLHGAPGDSARVYLAEAGGVVDSLPVKADARGEASGAFRVRPALAGWREWRVRAVWPRGDSAVAGAAAMVDSAGPPRVLLRAGFPDWEAKFVTRALEESGARVEQGLPLGRGLAVTEGAGSALTPARLAAADAVIVLDGAPLDAAEAAALAEWAARGGGVLLAGDRSGAPGFGLVRAGSRASPVDGSAIRWALPPELAPLPADRVAAAAQPFEAAFAGSVAGASSPAGGLLALRPLGRGRAAALAITETWRWRMEAGRVAEHREFWRSLADWLSSARPEPLSIQLADASGATGVRREVRVFDAREPDAPPPPLVVTRPDRATDTLRLTRDAASPGVLRASFVPAAEGIYTFAFAGQPPRAAFRATRTASASADGWARLAAIATRSGGRMLPPDSVRATVASFGSASSGGWRGPGPWLIFAAILLFGAAEWAIRRLTGRE
ncbi:hypothetical protein [Longimicrobium sp.]|uniref:hypothetical protein n=1 Tax=Longimicrobium sp. TaxID=2029185 RepID=UPI002CCA92C0|nr:hypothetical protein [Longimicrobium sp.]HSU14567.1 hypothetical protein [Longimicrobium sp.]